MMSRKILGLLIASGAFLFVFGTSVTHARATETHAKHHARTTHKATAHKAAAKPAKKVAARPKGPPPSLAIVIRAPNDAPDFDYRDRIEEAQALVAKQPVLKDDIQVDKNGKLFHFVWTLAVGQKTGPLTLVRMDETGKNDQGFTVTWPVDNFLNTKFHVEKPDGYIVFAQRRPVH